MKQLSDLRAKVKKLVTEAKFDGSRVTTRKYNGKPAIKLYIPIAKNGTWNNEYRERLNQLCAKISDLGLRWGAEYRGMNHLATSDENGEPWMLFNGGEAVELIQVEKV